MKNDDERVGLTVCFYQNPLALEEIQAWEAKMWNVITYKRRWQEKIFYLIEIPKPNENRPKLELLIAIPTSQIYGLTESKLIDWIVPEFERMGKFELDLVYGKTILFGAADSQRLKKIGFLTEQLEKWRIEQECEAKTGAIPL